MPVAFTSSFADIGARLGGAPAGSASELDDRFLHPASSWIVVGLPALAGILAVLVGTSVLIGWSMDVAALRAVVPYAPAMKPDTATCFLAVGGSLLLVLASRRLRPAAARRAARCARLLGAAALVPAVLGLLKRIGGPVVGVAHWLFPGALAQAGPEYASGMSAATALAFVLLGTALASTNVRWRPGIVVVQGLVLGATFIGLLGVLGYLYSAGALYHIPGYGTMTVQSAALFLCLGVATTLAHREYPLTAELVNGYRGATVARVLLPALIALPMLFGWAYLSAERWGWYGYAIGMALLAASMSAVSLAIVWFTARRLNCADREHRADEAVLRHFAALVQSSEDAIVGKTTEGIVTSWNPAAARLFGYDAEEIVGRSIATLIPPDRLHEETMILGRIRQGATLSSYETVRLTRNGDPIDVSVTVSPIRDADGRVVGASKIARDITSIRRAEAQLAALNAELEQRVQSRTAELRAVNAELESFGYAVAHDLRAPLRAMNGFSQALIEDFGATLDPEARRYLDHIIRGSTRMGGLIDGLLQLSRSTRGTLRHEPVDLSALADGVLRELVASEPGRTVTCEVAPGMIASGDERMLEAVMRNLIGNAWKYSAGRDTAHIRCYPDTVEGRPCFCVSDNGAGFDMAHSNMLFKPFQRLHRQDEFPGIGIGLATVQRIVHRHGGEVYARSSPGMGATFSFYLPGQATAGDPT
jgi:PAS domain S-box-containing protein